LLGVGVELEIHLDGPYGDTDKEVEENEAD
jgi:hypothetical protein